METPDASLLSRRNATDGIVFDEAGNPTEYHILRDHPGDVGVWSAVAGYGQYDRVPAERVIHWFRPERAEQRRGVSEVAPALELFALLRRYSLAVVSAAESVANASMVAQSDASDVEETEADAEAMDVFELERNMVTVLPKGYKLAQMKAEQPSATYAEFKKAVLAEIARCMDVPFNIAAGDSSGYNYSSGRLDHQTYFKMIEVERERVSRIVLDRVFAAWAREAVLISGYLSNKAKGVLGSTDVPDRRWMFDGRGHVDPAKEANAQKTRLESLMTTFADEYAEQGQDWERQLEQIAREQTLMNRLGITRAQAASAMAPAGHGGSGDAEDDQ